MPLRADVCTSSHCTLELLLELALGAVSGTGSGAAAGAGLGVAAVNEAQQITENGTQASSYGRIMENTCGSSTQSCLSDQDNCSFSQGEGRINSTSTRNARARGPGDQMNERAQRAREF